MSPSLTPIQSRLQPVRRVTEAEAQVAVHPEMIAGHHEDALLHSQPGDECRWS